VAKSKMPKKQTLSSNATPKPAQAQAWTMAPKVLRPLPRAFFDRDPRRVARELLGKVLVRRERSGVTVGRIVECEAYLGKNDPASHAYRGMTERNRVMFGAPGHCYVYFTYGMHYCANVSCQGEGKAGAVLLRALEPLEGIERMMTRRKVSVAKRTNNGSSRAASLHLLTSGPARLCEALAIDRERDNGKDLTDASSDLYLADDGYRATRVVTGPRIGITKAADRPLRYSIARNGFVSGKRN
jgi:DNA-3-methyladenine glycosylase